MRCVDSVHPSRLALFSMLGRMVASDPLPVGNNALMPRPSSNDSLFGESDPRFDDARGAVPSATALRVQPPTQAPLSAAAKAFNLQLTRIDKLKSQLQELDAWEQAHRLALHQNVTPLQKRHSQAMRAMALFLDERLGGKALAAGQRETARQILCGLARTLAEEGDTEMAALHDRHNPQTLAELARGRADALRAQLEEALGEPLGAEHEGASADEVLRAGMERLRQSVEDEQARRRAAAEKRKAKKKPNAAQAAVQAQMEDAETSLRKLFRQLASALHPDREPDAQARLAKTALMSEANAAYERKDLVALMQIQQRAALADPQAAAQMGDDKLAALTRLLKQQVADLERERAARNDRLAAEFQVPMGFGVTPKTLQMVLHDQVFELEEALALMQEDLERVQADAGLKRWLAEQRNATRRLRREQTQDDGFF